MKSFASLLFVTGSLVAPLGAANLLLNGDLEGNGLASGAIGSSVAPVNWVLTSGDVDLVNANLGVIGTNGPTWLEIGGSDGGVDNTILGQDFTVLITGLHQWSFDYTSWSGGGMFPVNFSLIKVGDLSVVDSVTVTPSAGDGSWQSYSNTGVLEAGQQYRFQFDDAASGGDPTQGAVLDNAFVDSVPEPSASLLLGLGALALLTRRVRA